MGGGTSLGRLTVEDGGTVMAPKLYIGTGGVLDGDGGIIDAILSLDGGVIAPGSSPGMLTVDGDFEVLGGLLDIEIGGTAPGSFDILKILGDFVSSDPFDVRSSFVDGFVPEVGDSFDFLQISGDNGNLAELVSMSLISLDFTGLSPSIEFRLVFADGGLSAFTERASASAIPVPASLPLLLAGLGVFGVLTRRRRAC